MIFRQQAAVWWLHRLAGRRMMVMASCWGAAVGCCNTMFLSSLLFEQHQRTKSLYDLNICCICGAIASAIGVASFRRRTCLHCEPMRGIIEWQIVLSIGFCKMLYFAIVCYFYFFSFFLCVFVCRMNCTFSQFAFGWRVWPGCGSGLTLSLSVKPFFWTIERYTTEWRHAVYSPGRSAECSKAHCRWNEKCVGDTKLSMTHLEGARKRVKEKCQTRDIGISNWKCFWSPSVIMQIICFCRFLLSIIL